MKTLYSKLNPELPIQKYRTVGKLTTYENDKWVETGSEFYHRQQMIQLIKEMPMEALERIFKFSYEQLKGCRVEGIDEIQIETSITI